MITDKQYNIVINELLSVLKKHNINTIPTILEIYGRLAHWLGLSIDRTLSNNMTTAEIHEKYAKTNNVGPALLVLGILVRTWIKDWEKQKEGESNGSNSVQHL